MDLIERTKESGLISDQPTQDRPVWTMPADKMPSQNRSKVGAARARLPVTGEWRAGRLQQ